MRRAQSAVLAFFVWDTVLNAPKTGDTANLTMRWVKDGGSPAAFTNAISEIDATNMPGWYKVTLTTTEATCNKGIIAGKSSTSNVVVVGQDIYFFDYDTLVDLVWDEILSTTNHNTANSAGRRLRTLNADILIFTGTAVTGSTNTVTLPAAGSAINDVYVGNTILIASGTGLGQSRRIIDYNGTTKLVTVDRNWSVTPNGTSVVEIYANSGTQNLVEGTVVSATASTAVIGAEGSSTNDLYTGSVITIVSGTGSGQARDISGYNGGTKTVTVASNWSVTPDSTSGYAIVPSGADAATSVFPTADQIAATTWAGFKVRRGQDLNNYPFIMTSATDGTPMTGLTVTVQRSLDGGSFSASGISGVAEIANGAYKFNANSVATDANMILFKFSATGANTWFEKIVTTP